ncbi:MAG: NAD(P)/FAD-dependent oxidoreductase [Rhizobiaceae bacterium]
MYDFETTIIGAGVIGLAIARQLARAGREVLVLERNGTHGSETSARNSEVVHAGIYYDRDSLKARLCVAGRQRLYAYCERNNVPFRRTGKLIVATDAGQEAQLESIALRAENNGADDLRLIDRSEVSALEPALTTRAALLSPSTGIIDSHAYMLALLGEAEEHGALIALASPALALAAVPGGYAIQVGGADPTRITTRELIVSGGLWSGQLVGASQTALAATAPTTSFAKGNYFGMTGRTPFSRLVYPVPEPGGLGVHLTLDLAGRARFGPDVEWIDAIDYAVDPARAERFVEAIRRYWPGLPDDALQPDYAGIRPKIGGREQPNADFSVVSDGKGMVALYGIESPGLTASLAIAEHVEALLNG